MQVFKTTLRIIIRSPIYLLIYIVLFGFLGLILVSATSEALPPIKQEAVREDSLPTLAIIDRDQSAVSEGITEFLEERSTPVALADDTRALQDATAKDLASYILIIPEGFGEAFLKAARLNAALPSLEAVVSFAQADGILMELLVNRYLNALSLSATLSPEASTAEVLDSAASAAALQTTSKLAMIPESPTATRGEVFYFLWISYPLSMGLIVLTGVIFATFRQGELRRRNLCAPHSASKINTRVAMGSVSLIFMTWAFLMLLALFPNVGGLQMLMNNPLTFVLLALAVLVYALVPFSLGFMLSQFGLKEAALNGAANILSLAFAFLSGAFMGGAAFLGETMQSIARVIPTYWYIEAVMSLTQGGMSNGVLLSYFANLGVVVLFALAIFSVALLMGKRGSRSTDSLGNTAAETA